MEKPERYQRGLDIINEYTLQDDEDVSTHADLIGDLKELNPELEDYIVEFAFGDISLGKYFFNDL